MKMINNEVNMTASLRKLSCKYSYIAMVQVRNHKFLISPYKNILSTFLPHNFFQSMRIMEHGISLKSLAHKGDFVSSSKSSRLRICKI